jgi:hypothetical protein
MATSVRLDDDFVSEVKIQADASNRSLPKQIEYLAVIGRMVKDNPDLSYEFIKDALLAKEQLKAGHVSKYERRTKRKS